MQPITVMKKLIPFLLFLLILSSCSNWKYGGKSRIAGNEVHYAEVIIDKNKVEPLVIDIPNTASKDVSLIEKTIPTSEIIESKLSKKNLVNTDLSWIPIQDKIVEVDDSLKKNEEILRQAMKNEKEGRKSTAFGILSIVLTFTPAFIVGFFFGLKGLKRSLRILDERYITPKGLKAAKAGFILSIIGMVLSSILIILLFTLLLLLLAFL